MKIISLALFHVTFIVAATARGFFDEHGAFSKKLDVDQSCVKNCSSYVSTGDCGSICKRNDDQFGKLMRKVYERVKEPLCDLDLGNISFGKVKIPLAIDNRHCHMQGPLNVLIQIRSQDAMGLDSCASTRPNYMLASGSSIAFQGLSMYCSSCPNAVNSPMDNRTHQLLGKANVELAYDDFHFTGPLMPIIDFGHSNAGVAYAFPAGDPKDVSRSDLQSALTNAFATANVLQTLNRYFFFLSMALMDNCILPTCGHNCPKH